jgi:hypothetical protein
MRAVNSNSQDSSFYSAGRTKFLIIALAKLLHCEVHCSQEPQVFSGLPHRDSPSEFLIFSLLLARQSQWNVSVVRCLERCAPFVVKAFAFPRLRAQVGRQCFPACGLAWPTSHPLAPPPGANANCSLRPAPFHRPPHQERPEHLQH